MIIRTNFSFPDERLLYEIIVIKLNRCVDDH